MMQETNTIGEWFLPGSNHKLPGRLLYDDTKKKIILEFIGNSHLDGNSIMGPAPTNPRYHTRFHNRTYKANHPIILGSADQEITLYYCQISTITEIGKDLHKVQYLVQYVFYGIHKLTPEDLQVLSGTIIYPYMGCWYDSEGFIKDENCLQDAIPFLNRTAYIGPSVITCREEMNIVISDTGNSSQDRKKNGVRLYKDKSVQFNYSKVTPFNDLIRDALTFRKLLEFAFGRPLYFLIQELQMIKNGQTVRISLWNVSHHKGQDVSNLTQHQRYMLLSDGNADRKILNHIIQKWFENQKYYVLYDYYIDSNHRFYDKEILLTNVMFNNRVLNLIQGLDSYHKNALQDPEPIANDEEKREFQKNKEAVVAILKNSGNRALKDWMHDKVTYRKAAPKPQPNIVVIIEQVIDLVKPSIPIFAQAWLFKEFPRLAGEIRDELSHGHHKETSMGPIMPIIFQLGQVILAACILRSLGVSEVQDKIQRYSPFSEYIPQILSHTVPAVPPATV
jgi:ApeA N-terminal domain 1